MFGVVALLIGCAGREHAVETTRVDSAGIAIVTSAVPVRVDSIGPEPAWRVVASADDATPVLFDVSDFTAMASGGVVVANAGSHQVVAIGADGRERWRFGRRGEGPGEFSGTVSLATLGDTVLAFDFNTRRLVRITPEGALASVMQIDLPDPNLELLAGRADGSLVFTSRHLLGPSEGINHDSVVYLAIGPDGSRIGEVGWGRRRDVDLVMGAYGPNIHDQALGPTGTVTSLGAGLADADGARPEVTLRDRSGAITRLLRWQEDAVPVTDADRAEFAAARRASTNDEFQRKQLDEWLDHATWSKTMPVTGLMAGRDDGTLLVAGACAEEAAGCAWREFDSAGAFRRSLWLPTNPILAVFAGGLLVTVSNDTQGLERLEGWRIPEW